MSRACWLEFDAQVMTHAYLGAKYLESSPPRSLPRLCDLLALASVGLTSCILLASTDTTCSNYGLLGNALTDVPLSYEFTCALV